MNTLIISTFSCTFEEFKNDVTTLFLEEMCKEFVTDYEFVKVNEHKSHLLMNCTDLEKLGAEKFLGGGGDYPGVELIGRYHAPGSLEGWIVLKTDDPKAIYQHAAEWGEFLNWETTPVFTDEEAGPIVAKVYS